ncbi:hypothetical protein [Pandoraea apista]|uniref:hypothetical protein n=1 Tax=Pandoraea apista TaxID=93218 RepID=UPI000AD96466|nr:hypothetical protein [Pandoraea apista]
MKPSSTYVTDWRALGMRLFHGRFLVRPSAYPDESYLGYRLRAAWSNGLSDPGWMSPVESRLPKMHGAARWCSLCLTAADGYWKEEWISGPAACFEHRCWLTSICAGCHRALRWKQARLSTCICGASLTLAKFEWFSQDVGCLIDDLSEGDARDLSVADRWELARFLGALCLFGLRGKPQKRASRRSEDMERNVVTAGAPLVIDRKACFELMDRLRVPQAASMCVPLLSDAFPHLLAMLRKQLAVGARRWLLELLNDYVEYAVSNGDALLWERKDRISSSDPRCGEMPRSSSIARIIRQTGEVVPVRRTKAGRRKFVVADASLQRMRQVQRSLLSAKAAARYIGLSSTRIRELVRLGLIDGVEGRIRKDSLDRMVSRVASISTGDEELVDPVRLGEALRRYVPTHASEVFFAKLTSGAIRLVDAGTVLGDFAVERSDVLESSLGTVTVCDQVSIVEAARRIGVKQEVMYHLVNVGLVRCRAGRLRTRAARTISIEELERFRHRFQPLVHVARAHGVSPRTALCWARENGIDVVSGPLVDGGRQYWIRTNSS